MSIIIVIAAASILIAGAFLLGFLWCVKDGQYDDSYSPPNRILFDETINTKNQTTNNN